MLNKGRKEEVKICKVENEDFSEVKGSEEGRGKAK